MFRYFTRLHEKYNLPIYPIALLSFDRPKTEQPDSYNIAIANLPVLQFRYEVVQLNRLDRRKYLKKANPVASALMAKMAIDIEDRPRVKLECLRLLVTLKLNPAKARFISKFIDAYLELNTTEELKLEKEIENILSPEKEVIMEYITSWEKKGIQIGLEQGLKQGLEQGLELGQKNEAQSLVTRLITRKLGAIEQQYQDKINGLSLEQLERLAEDLLDFVNQSDLFNWLDNQQV